MQYKFIKIALIGAMLLMAACDKNPVKDEEPEAPVLPPAESMQLDLSTFGFSGGSLAKSAGPQTQQNFNNAVLRVAIVNTIVAANLVIPGALFAAAISQKPQLGNDAKFHWIYQVTVGLTTYEADLAGWIDTNTKRVNWEMYVTNPRMSPPLDKFIWYDGWASLENQEGQWVFYNPQKPEQRDRVITIDWYHKDENDSRLTFKNVWESGEGKGDRLDYIVANTDRTMQFWDASENLTWTIFWDAVTTAGYLQVPGYNDGQPAYWDENHQDIPAP